MRSLTLVCLSLLSQPSFAWGPEGHSLIARIADAQLSDAVRARVQEILGAGRTMASVASRADEVRATRRETAPWHFVDIPIDESHYDPARDCAKADCIIATVSRLRGVLREPASSPDARREALEFLIHFVGDLHQPLHSSNNNDRGGNTVQLLFHDRQTNLHSLWDSGILNRLPPEDELFPALSQESAKKRGKWAKGTVTEWAEESHKAGRKVVYGKLPKGVDGQPATVDGAYEAAAVPVIRKQLERAGARLAWVLNTDLR